MPIPVPKPVLSFAYVDIDNSTTLGQQIGIEWEDKVRVPFVRRMRRLATVHKGGVFHHAGDGTIAAFQQATNAVAFAVEVQKSLASDRLDYQGRTITAKISVHTSGADIELSRLFHNKPLAWDNVDYNGPDLAYVARLNSIAKPGQTLLSERAYRDISTRLKAEYLWQEWPNRQLRSFETHESVWELCLSGSKGDPEHVYREPWYRPPAYGYIPRQDIHDFISRLMQDPNSRILTLRASGGSGKTELAKDRAHHLSDNFRDGVIYIELDRRFDDKADLSSQIGEHLGLSKDQSTPEEILRHLKHRHLLIVLEHFDYLLQGNISKERSPRKFLKDLLDSAPDVRVLITCRTITGIDGEQLIAVEGMKLHEAEQLFIAVAQQKVPGWKVEEGERDKFKKLIVDLCMSMPITIKIAASRVFGHTITEIEEGLRKTPLPAEIIDEEFENDSDSSLRHRSVERSIAWSYELLPSDLRDIFLALSFFPSGVTYDDFARALGEDTEPLLTRLLRTSLADRRVVSGKSILYLNSFVSSFARLEIDRNPTPRVLDLRDRIDRYLLSLASNAVPFLDGEDPDNTVDRLQSNIGNVREALLRVGTSDPHRIADLSVRLWHFWWVRGYAGLGIEILSSLLPRCRDDRNLYARAAFVIGHLERHRGHFARENQGDTNGAREWFDEALKHADDLAVRSDVLRMFGILEWHHKHLSESRAFFEHALEVANKSGDNLRIADAQFEIANNFLRETDPPAAIRAIELSRKLYGDSGDLSRIGTFVLALGNALYKEGRIDESRTRYSEALNLALRTRFKSRLAMTLERVARIAAEDNASPVHAANLLGFADELRKQIGNPVASLDYTEYMEYLIEALNKNLSPDGFEDARQAGTSMDLDEAIRIARKHL